ncbi:MDR family MFS transporter [Metabacillus halosaccharovorans]|uniref:MFS transporter n=1 Tax=Metabacillus halosaccharovorans TaxID=930124 RepID=A0ABT3DJU9_9BACI|nr:MDR family MFS transporter [Metabacillus halosaccharovorans]MCM3444119.1 MFS transporter [Metabacillus halosaccharovorans]MCV9887328.1 MFS transporter [Metabacillus halosaccharovorans]
MEHLENRQKVLIMIAIMSAMFFAAVNMTIVGTALPKIVSQIGGMEYFDWVFTVYMLTSTITAMLVGKLSDIYGRKIFILIGIGIFMIGAFLCGTSDDIIQLIMYRGLQGFGGGMIMSSAFTTVGDLFSPRERGRWQGLLGAVFGLSSLFGPTLGGYIVDNFDWHWIFWVFLPIGFFAFALILKLYPSQKAKEKEPIDFLGSITLTITIVSLLLGFTWAGDKFEWASFQIIGLFSLTLISLLAFIFIELKVKSPVLPLYLFKNSVFTVSNIAGMLMGMGMFGTIMYVPFYVQGVQGESATVSGLVEMVMTIAMVSSSILVGNLITKTGKYKIFALLGLIIMAIGLIMNSTLQVESSLTRLILQLIVVGIGLGVNMPVFNITVQNAVSHKYLGVATSAMQTFRQIGGTVGVALLGSVMGNKMANELSSTTQVENAPTPPPEMAETMSQLQNPQVLMDSEKLESIQSELPAEMAPFFEQFIQVLKEALNTSLTTVFTVSAGIIGLAFIVTLFLKEIPLRTTNNDEEENQEVEVERS